MDNQYISSDSFDTVSLSDEPFEPLEFDEQASKRIKTVIFTYIRQHYLKVIKCLLLFILILIIVIIFLSLLFYYYMNQTSASGRTSIPRYASSAQNVSNSTINVDFSTISNDTLITDNVQNRYLCNNVKSCRAKSCCIEELNYEQIKLYSCCGCIPKELRLVRFERSHSSNIVSLIFMTQDLSLSISDLALYPQLQGLQGIWDFIDQDDSLYLVYRAVTIVPCSKES